MALDGRTAIVTGAAQGMGFAFARELAGQGAVVYMCDIQAEALEKAAEEIRTEGYKAVPVRVDVSQEADVASAVEKAVTETGRLDILVNNAAIHPLKGIEEVSVDEWDKVLAVNLRSCFLFCRAAIPQMRKQKYGRIISIASEAGKNGGTICAPHYAASKGAILAFTRNLARAHGKDGITVNAIAPGRIATAMAMSVSKEENQVYIDKSSVKRLGDPVDVANAVAFLADERAGFVTGETLNVNGGTLMD
ncbi:MAG: SDR family NAD(P)-dependent oxidoreductase [Spirochaetaceae bacterium]